MKNLKVSYFLPLLIGLAIAAILKWWGFYIIFPWIGGWITVGIIIAARRKGREKDLGRRISILMIAPVFLLFIGIFQHENLQIEETVFYAILFFHTGIFTRVLIHYAIAKILGPLIWGRGFCGWACWTAAVLEWLPIRTNKPIPDGLARIRYLVLGLSILIPVIFILSGYDWVRNHITESGGVIVTSRMGSFLWFITGNIAYYAAAIILAFRFGKKRAFCKIACPVSIVMKAPARLAILRRRPSGNKCIQCGKCNAACPMDVDIMRSISAGEKLRSTECISCIACTGVCPQEAIL